jgi:hypothetical protein
MPVVGRVGFYMESRTVEIFTVIFLMGGGLRSNVNEEKVGIRDQDSEIEWL